MKAKSVHARDEALRIAANIAKLAGAFAEAVIRSVELIVQPEAHPRYSSLDVWPSRQARNAAAACSQSSALLNLRRGCFGGWLATGVAPLTSSTPYRRMRLRLAARDQFTTRHNALSPPAAINGGNDGGNARDSGRDRAPCRRARRRGMLG